MVGVYISGHPLDDFKIELNCFTNATLSQFNDMEKYVGRELVFGGVLTDVQHRVNKLGKGWAMFTMEDYNDSYTFRIFGEEYLKYRHFLVLNSFLCVKTVIRDGWINKTTGKKGDPRLLFNNFQLLQDVLKGSVKKLTINLDIKDLSDERVKDIYNLLAGFRDGNNSLSFSVFDGAERIKIDILR